MGGVETQTLVRSKVREKGRLVKECRCCCQRSMVSWFGDDGGAAGDVHSDGRKRQGGWLGAFPIYHLTRSMISNTTHMISIEPKFFATIWGVTRTLFKVLVFVTLASGSIGVQVTSEQLAWCYLWPELELHDEIEPRRSMLKPRSDYRSGLVVKLLRMYAIAFPQQSFNSQRPHGTKHSRNPSSRLPCTAKSTLEIPLPPLLDVPGRLLRISVPPILCSSSLIAVNRPGFSDGACTDNGACPRT